MIEFRELSDIGFEEDDVIPELVLLCSLMLRAPAQFLPSLGGSSEYKSDFRQRQSKMLKPLIPNLLAAYRDVFYRGDQQLNVLLPDVCTKCRTSFPLTVGGRLRQDCPLCHKNTRSTEESEEEREDVRHFINITWELCVFAVPSTLRDIILSQLIYKYYSPNGDKTWQLILPNLR